MAQTRVNRALVKVDAGEAKVLPTSETASTTKIVLIKTENISSVKRVKNLTRFEAEVTEETNKIKDVQSPVQAYSGRNGKPNLWASCAKVATNASTGPVDPE